MERDVPGKSSIGLETQLSRVRRLDFALVRSAARECDTLEESLRENTISVVVL